MKTTRTVAVVAAWATVGVLGAAALTGVATADEQPAGPSTASTTSAASTSSAAADLGTGAGQQARWRLLAGRVLHGEATVKGRGDAADAYRQIATQLGTLTAVSKQSITVRSEDGVTWTWALTGDTAVRTGRQVSSLADLEGGASVRVVGPVDDGSRTARLVVLRPAAG